MRMSPRRPTEAVAEADEAQDAADEVAADDAAAAGAESPEEAPPPRLPPRTPRSNQAVVREGPHPSGVRAFSLSAGSPRAPARPSYSGVGE
jgi:hypothetical protein